MSPVSRGFAGFLRQQSFRLPSSLRAAVFGGREQFFQPNTIRNSRNFGSSFLRRYEYQYKSQLAQKPSVFVNNDPVLRQVAQTRQPVTIYRAPKNRWYYLKVYGTAALWIGTGAYSIKFQDDVKDLKDLAFFIRPTYVVVGIGFIIIGSYICTAPVNRMRALEVLPSIHGGPMQLRMTVRSAPWTKERVVFANLGGPTISEKTNPMVEELMEAERARKQSVFQGLEHESIITRSWEYSARWVHQKWTNFFLSFKFAVLRFGIAKVEVQGEKWKIDCSGWLLEDGKAIDRLIPEE
ncbi:hypothetical protein HBI56_005600 [Parastagonospora nodorum]|uniref:Uncharacterized protein n=1 Tax=Phaeosphaeria nodorum (strain SN15 / ATCC MYA-4574 / FGSC 10173) TaxID=321614 RepID=A0A7U2EQH3_PHANO|nr:hypothetical protein HBH56_124070 [Parastagonospora nodorum]QRC91178.1 hypothetical protein JI435_006790 [Parastagonospora nodorum SN15]KAH3935107.1 hypothetical protein HBH54_049610 [Parastagonospora nodorum]KAH3950371.1 hypothetical protein HBH53_079750 [Parastagonospora nodorum]KAH3982615.1 hypothetical protein HBH51_037520 [Parastagonospora nodorum]